VVKEVAGCEEGVWVVTVEMETVVVVVVAMEEKEGEAEGLSSADTVEARVEEAEVGGNKYRKTRDLQDVPNGLFLVEIAQYETRFDSRTCDPMVSIPPCTRVKCTSQEARS
jgi:hypothetical protein